MAVTEIGYRGAETNRINERKPNDILFRTYSYQNGKGQEKVYYAKDCVEISVDSFKIPPTADNYEEVRNMLKAQNGGKITALPNRMFYETYEVMQDYYDGKLSQDEVKDIFREYFYHYMGTCVKDAGKQETQKAVLRSGDGTALATKYLAGLYEHFSRANTRNACTQNRKEGRELMEGNGMSSNGSIYYNADWYYACEEMQELFRDTANELADEFGVEHVDFKYVEENTRFTLDGGITYNGVWSARVWQMSSQSAVKGGMTDQNMAPPRGFVYCSSGYVWNGKGDTEGIQEEIRNRRKGYDSMMFIMASARPTEMGGSLLLDPKHYGSSSRWEDNASYRQGISFLSNFNIYWGCRGSRWEFMACGE